MDATFTMGTQTGEKDAGESGEPAFKSPPRILARSFRLSRDGWKTKYMAQKPALKRLRVQAADAQQARDQFRERAQAAEAEAAQLRRELASAQALLAERNAAEKKGG